MSQEMLPHTSSEQNPKLPWFVRSKSGNVVFFGAVMVVAAIGLCIVLTLQGIPLGLVEWVFIVGVAAVSGPLSGLMFWFLYTQPQLSKHASVRRNTGAGKV